MKALLEAGADPNKESLGGDIAFKPLNLVIAPDDYNIETHEFSPLTEDRMKCVVLLLEYGAEANSVTQVGERPLAQALTYAAGTMREKLVTLLLDKGADLAAALAAMEQFGEKGLPEYYYALHEVYQGAVQAVTTRHAGGESFVFPDNGKSEKYLKRAAAFGYAPALAKQEKTADSAKGSNVVKDLLDFFRKNDGSAWVCRPATDEDIEQCKKNLKELGLEALPQGYEDFLKTCNGFSWNSVEFWGTDKVSEKEDSSYSLMDTVTMNDDLDEHYSKDLETELFYLGRADDDIYVYSTDAKRYEVRTMEEACHEVYESFETFGELFVHVVGGRLGWGNNNEDDEDPDDPEDLDEGQYEHDEGRYDGEV
jgi:hypothetical protein